MIDVEQYNPPPAAQPDIRPSLPRRVVRGIYRLVRGLLAFGMLMQILLVCTPLTEVLFGVLNVTEAPRKADYIVCLGGNSARIAWSAELYHDGYAPAIIVSNRPEAATGMRDMLIDAGVPGDQVFVDDSSFTTGDHPAGVRNAGDLDPETVSLVIVTNAQHSRRVAAVFEHAGYKDFTIYGGPPSGVEEPDKKWRWRVLVVPYIAYEFAALIQYWWQDRI